VSDVVAEVIELLSHRCRQRGFIMVGEIQQELEDADAPSDSFELVTLKLMEAGMDVREESEDALFDTAMSSDELVHVSDPVRMYLQEIGRYPLLTTQQEVELSMQVEAGIKAEERLDSKIRVEPAPRGFDRKEVRRAWDGPARSDPGGEPRTHSGSREVRLPQRFQIFDLCHVVDPSGRDQGTC